MSWLDKFFTGGIKNVAIAGALLPQEVTINFVSGATAADNPSLSRTDVTISALATPTGTGFVHVTGGVVDPAARAVNVGTADVTGVLAVANGGTGLSAGGSAGQVLTMVSGAPAWANAFITAWGSDLVNSNATNQFVSSLSFNNTAAGGSIGINGTATSLTWASNATPLYQQTSVAGAGADMSFAPQASTGGKSGNFLVNLANPGAGSANAVFSASQGGNGTCVIGQQPGSNSGQACMWFNTLPASISSTNFNLNMAGTTLNIAGSFLSSGSVAIVNGGQNLIQGTYNGSYILTLVNGAVAQNAGGSGVIVIGQAGTVPTSAAPTNCGILYMNSGSPGSLGLVTTGIAFHRLAGAITINQDAATTDVAATKLTISGQSAWTSAATNINGANTIIASGDSKVSGTTGLRGFSALALGTSTPSYQFFVSEPAVGKFNAGLFCGQNNLMQSGNNLLILGSGTAPSSASWNSGGQGNALWADGTGGIRGIAQINNSSTATGHLSQILAAGQALNAADPHTQVLSHQRIRTYGRTTTSGGTLTTLLPAVPSACVREMRVTVLGRVAVASTGFVLDDSFALYRINNVVNHSGTAAQLGTLPAVLETSSTASVSASTVTFTFSTSHADVVVTAPTSATPPTMDWTIDVEILDN